MRGLKKKFRRFLRGTYRVSMGLSGFYYDFKRFLLYGGWKEDLYDVETRNYNIMMAYHGLEKSLSYKNRNPKSGWSNAERVFLRLKIANDSKKIGFHDRLAKETLKKFLTLRENQGVKRGLEMLNVLEQMDFGSDEKSGTVEISSDTFSKGVLENPEEFFFSRYSLREFKDQIVDDRIIRRAVNLAMKTPSVCNRHPWHIYHTNKKDTIQKVLRHQNGNRPFGEKANNLLVITTDLKAFFSGAEHYQHWIDGGLISMSLMYAFHSLGIASCPLNWSQTPKNDMELRKVVNINNNHTIIMMMIIGHPDLDNKVCASSRRPMEDIFTEIKISENENSNNNSTKSN